MSTKSTRLSLNKIQQYVSFLIQIKPNDINHMFKFCLYKNYDWKYWEIKQWWNDKSKENIISDINEDKHDEDIKTADISNEVKRFVNFDQDAPLNQFTVNDICYAITKWFHNDIKYKDQILKTERIFAHHELDGDKIMILSVEAIKRIVKEDMIEFTRENALNIMFEGFSKWIKTETKDTIKSKSAKFIANILFHHPLNQLIQQIKRDKIDGKKFIKIDQQFIAQETGWHDEQVEQIQLILMRYSAITTEEFNINMDNIFKQEITDDSKSTEQIPNNIISQIKTIIKQFDVETLQYNYKNNKITDDVEKFNDKIYNMMNELFSEADESDDTVSQIYTKVAKCFTFNYDIINDDINDFTREWVCSNCGNCNFCKYIAGKLKTILSDCTLCGITQTESVILQIRNYDRYTMVSEKKGIPRTIDDIKEETQDDVDDTIKEVSSKITYMHCPNRNDEKKCPSMIRLAKQLIQYNKSLTQLPKYDIKSTVEVDIANIDKSTFKHLFIKNVKSCKKLGENEQQSVIKLVENNVDNLSNLKTFLNNNRKTFIQMICKKLPAIKPAQISKLYANIQTSLKQEAHSKQFLTNLNMDIIEKDYQHVLNTHINSSQTRTFRRDAFTFFQQVVHYNDVDSTIERLGCRSVERTAIRTKQMLSQVVSKQKTSNDKDLWKKRQQYNQSQLDIFHSYLVHYNENKANQQNDDNANKGKYVSGAEYGFGVSHEHHHLQPIFNSIYQEMMDNELCKLTYTNFEDELTKAILKLEVALRDHEELICKYYSKHYKIIRNDPIGIRHILCIVIYTDMSNFCTAFRKTFRTMFEKETDQQVAQRHEALYHYSRALFEAAEFFGTHMDETMTVYHGLDKRMNFKEFHAYFNQPISTTTSKAAAQVFSRGNGIILTFRSAAKHLRNASKTPKYLSVSWASDFPGEEEKLFYGAYIIFEISNITEAETLKDHSKELSSFNDFQKLIQNKAIKWSDNINSNTLTTFINQRRKIDDEEKSASTYGTDLFNYFCDNVSWVSVQRFPDLPKNLKNAMFYSNNEISILSLLQIFPNLQEIALTGLKMEEIEKQGVEFSEAVYRCISHPNKTHQHLKKISFKTKRQNDTKERTTLKRLQSTDYKKFKNYEWTINYQCKMENEHALAFTNDVIETADKIKNLQENIKKLEIQKIAIARELKTTQAVNNYEKWKANESDSNETSDEYEQDSFIVDITDKNDKFTKIYQANATQIEQQKRKIKKQVEMKHNTKQYQRDSQVIQNGGLFQIKVHIIKCTRLKSEAKDISTRIRIFNEQQSTKPISKAGKKYWGMNHMLYFKFDLAPDELLRGKCLITVYNEKMVLRDIQIGSYEFDLSMIYYKKNHEIYNQWVALVNTSKSLQTDDEKDNEINATDKGIDGYMLVSIIILGPNDEQFIHKEDDPLPSLQSAKLLKPPDIVQKPYLLTVKVHKLRNLARADKFISPKNSIHQARGTGNLDPMVYVEYAGLILRSKKVWEGSDPVISTQFLLPVMEPVFHKDIIITVVNYSLLKRNDRVGCVRVDYRFLRSRTNLVQNDDKEINLYHVKPRWYHMYGAPIGYSKGYARRMNKGLIDGSNYRGSALLEFIVKKCDTKTIANILPIKECNEIDSDDYKLQSKQKQTSTLVNEFDDYEQKSEKTQMKKHTCKHGPAELDCYIRAYIYEGTEINAISDVGSGEFCIEIAVANCKGKSSWKPIREKNAYIQWYEILENMDMNAEKSTSFTTKDDKNKLIGPFKIPVNWEEDDIVELPDVCIYGMTNRTEPIVYCRVPLRSILSKKQTNTWYDMKKNFAVNRYDKDVVPGSLLIGLNAAVIKTKQRKSHQKLPLSLKNVNDSKFDKFEIDNWDTKETDAAEKQTKYSKKKKKKLGHTIKNTFDTKQEILPGFAKISERRPMTLFISLLKGRNLLNVDAFIKIRFCGIEKQSAILNNNIDPHWNEILTLRADVPYFSSLNTPARIYCEILDRDIFKNSSIGRLTFNAGTVIQDMEKNGHNMKLYEHDYAEKYASWHSLENSQKKFLIAFQLTDGTSSSTDLIPRNVFSQTKVKYNLQIFTFGLRNIKSIFGVHKTFIEFEINGITYATNESNIPDRHNPNFQKIVKFCIMLPENANFWPDLNIKIIDSLCGGAIKRTIGYSSIDISQYRRYAEDEIKESQEDELKDDKIDFPKENVSNAIYNTEYIKKKSIFKNNNGYHEVAQDSDDEHDQEHYSPFDYEVFDCCKDYELGMSGAKYMDKRKTFETELENRINLAPFHEESIFSGKNKEKSVAKFKGHISLTKYDDKSSNNIKYMKTKELFVLRLYILYAENLTPNDNVGMEYENAASTDPYLKIKFADTEISTRDRFISRTLNPEFFESFVFPVTFPGPSKLILEVWDYDGIGGIGDDLLGQTIIDIEDRWYSAAWREYTARTGNDIPVEGRTLHVNESKRKLGKLFLWIELLPPDKHKRMPMKNIKLDTKTDHELRLVIWECKDVKDDDELRKCDLYITGNLQCTTEEDEPNLQETDTHLRSHDGKGSFNWRMKFPLKLPKRRPFDCPRLKLQIWDMDFFSGNDCISEAVIPLAGFLRYYDIHCQNNVTLRMVNNNDDNDDNDDPEKFKFWIDLDEENNLVDEEDVLLTKTWNSMKDTVTSLFKNRGKGKILMSLEILPIKNAKRLSNGFGRDKPNRYPKLEEPKGRHKFTWNPFRLLKNIIGAYRCGQLTCICVWIGIFAFLLLITPNLISATFANIMIH